MAYVMSNSRQIKIFVNGRNRAVRIPQDFVFPGDTALIHQEEDGRIVLETVKPRSLAAVLASWEPIDEQLPEITDASPDAVNL